MGIRAISIRAVCKIIGISRIEFTNGIDRKKSYQQNKNKDIGTVLKYNKRKVLCKYKIIFRNRQAYISNLIK